MTQESIQPILQWISQHPTWAGLVVFLISLSESLVVIGLIIPGVVMMTAIGVMMGNGILPLFQTMVWAILGAIAGDGMSYWVGHHYHQKLRRVWPFSRYPQWLARGETFFRKHGGKSIILGRFVGPVRPMIPVIAGMMDMTPRHFLIFNILSAIAWAPIYTLPGIMIGASLGTISPETASRIAILLLVFLFILWVLYTFVLSLFLAIVKYIKQGLNWVWRQWKRRPIMPALRDVLSNHHTPIYSSKTQKIRYPGQLGLLLIGFLAIIGLWITTEATIYVGHGLASWNEPIYQALRALYNDNVIDYFAVITNFGDPKVLIPVATLIGLWLFWHKHWVTAFCWLGTIGCAIGVGYLMKHFIISPRPFGLVVSSTDNSFPSGHALSATLVFSFMALLSQHRLPENRRWIPWLVAVPMILLISFSRLYLGKHWFTDILGAWSLALLFLCLGWIAYRRFSKPNHHHAPVLIGLALLTLFTGLYTWKKYPYQRAALHRQWEVSILSEPQWWQGNAFGPELTHRQGAFKQQATLFDLQWLGDINTIEYQLTEAGWTSVPKLTTSSSLALFAKNPKPNAFPVMPKFHRDRLPILRMTKPIGPNDRFVIQLWQSDQKTPQGTTLWVGTLRHEQAKPLMPLVTLYREQFPTLDDFKTLFENLQRHLGKVKIKFMPVPAEFDETGHKQVLLIEERQ